jgi:predicted O-methyltransferase YrrM
MEHKLKLTHDWISGYHAIWQRILVGNTVAKPRILEIGCYEGRSTVWFLENLKPRNITCIDTFQGDDDLRKCGVNFDGVKDRFLHNVSPWKDDVTLLVGLSEYLLRFQPLQGFEIILVDGDHSASAVYQDAALAWGLLKKGGVMIFDDFLWGQDRPDKEKPFVPLEAFLKSFEGQIEVLEKGYQLIVKKL